MPPSPTNLRAYLLLSITTLCFGMNANLGRVAVGEVSPMLLVVLRWAGTVVLLLLLARHRLVAAWPRLRPSILPLLGMGMLGLSVFNALFYVAAYTTGALNLGIIQGSIPIFVLVGSVALYRSQVRALQVMGILITLLGVLMVTVQGDWQQLVALAFKPGDLLMVVACILYAGYSIGLKHCPQVDHLALFTVLAIGALLAGLALSLAEFALGYTQWPSATGWFVVGLVTLFPSFLAQLCFIKGVSLIGADRAGIFFNLVPVFAALIAVLFLGEVFAWFHAAALLLVLGGIAASEWRPGQG